MLTKAQKRHAARSKARANRCIRRTMDHFKEHFRRQLTVIEEKIRTDKLRKEHPKLPEVLPKIAEILTRIIAADNLVEVDLWVKDGVRLVDQCSVDADKLEDGTDNGLDAADVTTQETGVVTSSVTIGEVAEL